MNKIIRKLGWPITVTAAVVVPLVLWLSVNSPADSLSSIWIFSSSLGKILGIMGICFYSINLILASRWRFIEPFFGGLNRVYIAHHIIGGIALIMLLFHPILLAIQKASLSWYESLKFLIPNVNLAINLGILALTGLVLLLILTFYVKLPYAVWKFTHKFLGVFFGIAILHVLLINSADMETSILLKAYVLGLAGLGLIAFTYRSLLPRIFVRTYEYTVEQVKLLKPNVVEVMMAPKNELLNFKAGQFVFVSFVGSPLVNSEPHPFSIESAVAQSRVTIVAKMLGDYTASLPQLKAGTTAMIEGAYGSFSYTNFPNRNQIWIAGGIGITPFVSMARDLANKPEFNVDLYYSCKTADEFVYLDVLFYDLAKKHPNFRLITYATETQGNLTADKIKELSGEVKGKEIFICGPPPMMKALKGQFVRQGISKDNLHTEEFSIS